MFDYERFSQLSKEKGIKKSFLYQKVGWPDDSNSNLKRLKNVNPEFIKIWADILGTTVAYLNGETDEKEKPTAYSDGGLLEMYNQLSDVEREQVMQKVHELLKAHESTL